LNIKPPVQNNQAQQSQDGFTKVPNRRRGNKKATNPPKRLPEEKSKPSTSNSFVALENAEDQDEVMAEKSTQTAAKPMAQNDQQEGKKKATNSETGNNPEMEIDNNGTRQEKGKETEESTQEPQIMEEDGETIDIGELDILGLEQACKSGKFDKITDTQVDNLVEVLSKAQKKYSLGVQKGSQWDGNFFSKDSKKRGRKSTLERTIKIGEVLVESGRYAKLTKYYNSNPKLSQ